MLRCPVNSFTGAQTTQYPTIEQGAEQHQYIYQFVGQAALAVPEHRLTAAAHYSDCQKMFEDTQWVTINWETMTSAIP